MAYNPVEECLPLAWSSWLMSLATAHPATHVLDLETLNPKPQTLNPKP